MKARAAIVHIFVMCDYEADAALGDGENLPQKPARRLIEACCALAGVNWRGDLTESQTGAGAIVLPVERGGTLPLIAAHRRAASALDDAAETEREAASEAEIAAFNALFSAQPATAVDLLALLRHVERHVEDSTGNEGSISLRNLVTAIGDAVEGLRTATSTAASTSSTTSTCSADAFLLDLAPDLLPLLDEADARWAATRILGEKRDAAQAEAAGPAPSHDALADEWKTWRARMDDPRNDCGYSASWDANQPPFDRLEAMVGPYMNVPVQTLDGLLLKQRIGRTLEHYEDNVVDDLAKLVRARFGHAEREVRS